MCKLQLFLNEFSSPSAPIRVFQQDKILQISDEIRFTYIFTYVVLIFCLILHLLMVCGRIRSAKISLENTI